MQAFQELQVKFFNLTAQQKHVRAVGVHLPSLSSSEGAEASLCNTGVCLAPADNQGRPHCCSHAGAAGSDGGHSQNLCCHRQSVRKLLLICRYLVPGHGLLKTLSCGRYFLTPQEELRKPLTETDAEAKKESTLLLEKREVLEKQSKAAEAELRELLQHSPALARALASHEG